MKKVNKEQKQISIQVNGPMLEVLVHCTTEAQTIKKLKELKNLINPPGKHHFQIIYNHPNHPLNFK